MSIHSTVLAAAWQTAPHCASVLHAVVKCACACMVSSGLSQYLLATIMPRNLTDDEITKLLPDWESQEEELAEDVVGSVDCESGLINNDNSDQLQVAISFSIIDESDNSDFVHISNR